MTRYALYYTPPEESPLATLGRAWFGDPAVVALTRQARVYGFHATLKAPFRLAEASSPAQLEAALEAFCAERPPVEAGALALADLDGFLALVPEAPSEALDRLAADCVGLFDRFRAPAGEAELARRRAAGLSSRQDANLTRWGYPYVFADFRFHMTLTRRLSAEEAADARARLAPLLEPALAGPLRIDAVSLCVQPAPDAAFEVSRRCRLAG